MILKIVSGGQTGVDQAALDSAIKHCIQHGGWLPHGRMTEKGPLPEKYRLREMVGGSYPQRTQKNVEDSDATLIFSRGPLTGGSELTEKIARRLKKPVLHIDLSMHDSSDICELICTWLQECEPEILNIAGPRGSSDPAIYDDVMALLESLWQINGVVKRSATR